MKLLKGAPVAMLALLALLAACRTNGGMGPEDEISAIEPGASAAMLEKEGVEAIDNMIVAAEGKTDGGRADAEDPDDAGAVGDEISHNTTQSIPLEINDEVEKWIEYFTVRDGERFRRFLERGERYKPMITSVLRDQGIPTEIYYQAMIESGFATHAKSHASAVGIWQFIRDTGRRYGLRIDQYVDERRDPMRATIAAALYMKDLYNVFQDWYLAMAAYNAGEGRILGAIMRAKTRDFWEMVRTRALPDETMNYIPKFLAATSIGHSPRRYGFEDLRPEMMPALASVAVASPVRISDVARVSGVPLEVLKEANPHLMRGMTPPGVSTYRIWVPKDQVAAVEGKLEAIAAARVRNLSETRVAEAPGSEGEKPKVHVVARGETLAQIAGAYGLSMTKIKSINGMKSSRVRVGQKLTIWKPSSTTFTKYKVRRGDNLNDIARRFGVSIGEIKRLNRLKRNTLYVGQVLKVGERRG